VKGLGVCASRPTRGPRHQFSRYRPARLENNDENVRAHMHTLSLYVFYITNFERETFSHACTCDNECVGEAESRARRAPV